MENYSKTSKTIPNEPVPQSGTQRSCRSTINLAWNIVNPIAQNKIKRTGDKVNLEKQKQH